MTRPDPRIYGLVNLANQSVSDSTPRQWLASIAADGFGAEAKRAIRAKAQGCDGILWQLPGGYVLDELPVNYRDHQDPLGLLKAQSLYPTQIGTLYDATTSIIDADLILLVYHGAPHAAGFRTDTAKPRWREVKRWMADVRRLHDPRAIMAWDAVPGNVPEAIDPLAVGINEFCEGVATDALWKHQPRILADQARESEEAGTRVLPLDHDAEVIGFHTRRYGGTISGDNDPDQLLTWSAQWYNLDQARGYSSAFYLGMFTDSPYNFTVEDLIDRAAEL